MRVLVLTSQEMGTASALLDRLAGSPGIEIAMVVLNEGVNPNPGPLRRRKVAKLLQIGLAGALNGLRMRRWYREDVRRFLDLRPVGELCADLGIPFERTPWINSDRTRELFRRADADVGLSLGNGYIGRSVFEIPRLGMVNVHHAELPRYRNAQSVVWELFEGDPNVGYTIHQIDAEIDHGDILIRESFPIEIRPTLRETVAFNYARLVSRSADGLVRVLGSFDWFARNGEPQGTGRRYTTPSLAQYVRIRGEFLRRRRCALDGG